MLLIHDILVWIRIRIWVRGSMPLTNGSGSCYFRHWPSRCQQKNIFFLQVCFAYYFFKVPYIYMIFKDKKSKRSHKVVPRNQGFSDYFCLVMERIGSGSESIPLTKGSGPGSRRPKNMWIRIRIWILNTGRSFFNLNCITKREFMVLVFVRFHLIYCTVLSWWYLAVLWSRIRSDPGLCGQVRPGSAIIVPIPDPNLTFWQEIVWFLANFTSKCPIRLWLYAYILGKSKKCFKSLAVLSTPTTFT